jgi:hypothetical protein
MTRRTITVFLGLLLVVAAGALGSCSRKGTTGQRTETGFFTGYELGNEQDQAEIRKDRPEYRPHE